MRPRIPTLLLCFVALVLSAFSLEAREGRLLRFADVHEDRVVFVYAGDLWIAPSSGGTATRLTADVGLELFPKFSPDGRQIAFSAEYGGNRQVFVLPVEGGTPRQLTFYNDVGPMPPRGGFDYRVLDWTPDGSAILVRANRLPWGERMGRYFLVPAEGGMERALPIPEGGGASFSPDGTRLAYTPIDREFRTWKRYHGGRAQDVWIYDLERNSAEAITSFSGTDNQPVWVGDRIYFTSDRDRRLNLYAYDPRSGETVEVTHHRDFDVLWPSGGPHQVVYECGGYLYRFDPASGSSVRIPIELPGDFAGALPRLEPGVDQIAALEISPTGKRALFEARGDVFTVPAEEGVIRNLTRTPGIRELAPTWSPDGRWVAYLSDRTGEYELFVRPHEGGDERRITTDGDVWRFPPVWSPDSAKLAFGDRRQRLRTVDVESGRLTDVDRSERNDITSYVFSPDSRFLVYVKLDETQRSSLYLYSFDDGSVARLTGDETNDYGPAFEPSGRYLYFLSDRDFNLTFSGYEFNYVYTNPTRIYVAVLAADGPPLLRRRNDDEGVQSSADDSGEEKSEATVPRVVIDIAGFGDRVSVLPGPSARYSSLQASKDGLFYLVGSDGGGRGNDGAGRLERFSLEKEKSEQISDGVDAYSLSRDGKKLLLQQGSAYRIVDAGSLQNGDEGRLDLEGLELHIEPTAEWREIYHDAARIVRDWFYDPNLHGVDWQGLVELYAPLVESVAHRADLDYIFGELGGELSAGHFYVSWGDFLRPERVENGLLGAEIVAHESGAFRIARIFRGENWAPRSRSPLTEAGVHVDEGDFILSVDGRSTREVKNFYELLEGKADQPVLLEVNDRPSEDGARIEQVRPIAHETDLRYLDWVRSRQEMVERLSGGRIGYLHLPDTAQDGNRELQKHFLPQARKEALIIDVRYNGGGFIPDRMIELLARPQLSFWARRGVEAQRTPVFAHSGPKVCLINGYSSSGGDAFPYYFRKVGLGKLIGTRTWGGLIGLSGNPGLMDGGSLNLPRFRFFDTEGRWAVEGEGVAPDIEVVDRPDLVAAGRDPSLEKAVEVLLEELERNPPRPVEAPVPPVIPRD